MDNVFELIKNLDKGEKSFFSQYSKMISKDRNPEYLRLFHLIDKQTTYDEKKLIRQLKFKNFTYQKHYLYEQLLNAIKIYHDQESDKKMANHYMEIVDVLMRKRLLKQAEKILGKAEKLCKKLMDSVLQIKLIQLKLELLKAPQKVENLDVRGNQLMELVLSASDLYKDQMSISNLIIKMLHVLRKGMPANHPEGMATMKEILEHELIRDEQRCVSFYDKTNRLIILNVVYTWFGEHEKSYEAKKEHLRIYEGRPDIIKTTPANYLTPLNNIINGAIYQGKVGEAIIFLTKLEAFKESLKENSQVRRVATAQIALNSTKLFAFEYKKHLPQHILSNALEYLVEIKESDIRDINASFSFFYLAQYYFSIKNYDACLQSKRNFYATESDHQKFLFYRLLSDFYEVICHIEEEATGPTESIINSLFKRRKKDECFTPFLVELITYLKKTTTAVRSKAMSKWQGDEELSKEEQPLLDWWNNRR